MGERSREQVYIGPLMRSGQQHRWDNNYQRQYLDEVHMPVVCVWHNAAIKELQIMVDSKADVTPSKLTDRLRYAGVSASRYEVARFLVWATNKPHLIGGNWSRYCSDTAETSGVNEQALYKYVDPPRRNLFGVLASVLKNKTWCN